MSDASTSTEIAVARLRETILRGELRPGDKLHQDQLAEMLGVSRTPLRTALTALTQSGLVVYESNRGFRVREFSYEEMVGAFEVRAELEAMACRKAAANMTTEVAERLAALVEEGDALLAPGELVADNLGSYRQMNVAFHDLVIRIAGNPWIRDFVERLHDVPMASDRIIMWRDYDVIRRSHDDHRRIARALARGQGDRAGAIMHEHITYALEHLLSHLELYPDDFLRVPAATVPAGRSRRGTNSRRKT
nr:GntR family transcriptional regulator [Mangrovicoccus sp. HB161399]